MSSLINMTDLSEVISNLFISLKAAGYSSSAMMPVHQNTSSEVEKTEVRASNPPEILKIPGQQYRNAEHAMFELKHDLGGKGPLRDSYNEKLDFTYASIQSWQQLLAEKLYQYGLAWRQDSVEVDKKTDTLTHKMVTTFTHLPTGTSVSYTLPYYVKQDKNLNSSQEQGASLTYFCRYALRQALGIADGDDDADQSTAKKARRDARDEADKLLIQRKFRPVASDRTENESILNLLVAAGVFTGKAAIEQAKSRNSYLRTPNEVAEEIRAGKHNDLDDETVARDIVARFGLADPCWVAWYEVDKKGKRGYRIDSDLLIDNSTGKHVTAERATAIAKGFIQWATSAADNLNIHDSGDTPAFTPDRTPLNAAEENFVSVIETGHDREIIAIAKEFMECHESLGVNVTSLENDCNYHRRNWYNACREFYVLSLTRGNADFSSLANPGIALPLPDGKLPVYIPESDLPY
ncbi:hypothetical protein AVB34_04085 [Salmonella enterica subsp. enterica serovar Lindern]|nr:hypothetical protein [Salmonella enterica subsp. enterica serovar Lindern]